MTTIFKTPFATQGDKASIPVEIQPDGSVSYTQGYGYDYERDQVTDPAAKDIEREKMNGIFHDITEAIGEIQRFGFPKWDEAGKPYAIRAIVYHKNKVWQSKVENNNIEPVAGNAWAELKADATASDVGAYSKGESDKRFQPLGNYTPSGYSYSKAETDTKYQPKGNYAPAGNYANKGDSYTKTESDGRYQAKGSYQPSGNYALAGASYIKAESDGRYQPKGNYLRTDSTGDTKLFNYGVGKHAYISWNEGGKRTAYIGFGNDGADVLTINNVKQGGSLGIYKDKITLNSQTVLTDSNGYTRDMSDGKFQPKGNYATAGSSYTKAESDGRYQGKGNYQPAGNYALVGASYTKAESDGKYQPKGSYQASGYSYSKSESDGKYQPKGSYVPNTRKINGKQLSSDISINIGDIKLKNARKIWNGNAPQGTLIKLNESIKGCLCEFGVAEENKSTIAFVSPRPVKTVINIRQGATGFVDIIIEPDGRGFTVLGAQWATLKDIWILE
ncbi:TPA: hypothetical protein ACKRE5_001365 [Proteus mirabilis]